MKRIALIAVLLLTGCAAPHTMLVNARTGEVQTCRPSRYYRPTLVGQIVSIMETSSCSKQLEAMGFKRTEDLTDADRAGMQPRVVNPEQRYSIDISR